MEAEHLIISMCSWLPVKAARRVRHQLQVDERGLDQGVSQPAAQVVDLDVVHQQVACVAVPQGVRAYLAPGHDRPQLLSPPDRRLDPAPRRCAARPSTARA